MKKISIFGKSTVAETDFDYQVIKKLSKKLVEHKYTCVHGGYAGGIMQAVADGAHEAVVELSLEESRYNIGVPEKRFDEKWPRVSHAHFTEAADDIFSRLKMITDSDVFVVAPAGGDGTFLEADIVIHENTINHLLGKPVKPIIFIEGGDKKWIHLFNARLQHLDISKRDVSDYSYVHFISYEEQDSLDSVSDKILEKINQVV